MVASTSNSEILTVSTKKRLRTSKDSDPSKSKLNESLKLLALAEEVAHFGSWEWDVAQPRAIWSPEMFRIFGIKPRFGGLTLEEYKSFIHPEDLAEISKLMERSFVEAILNQKSEVDYRITRKDGSVRLIHSQRQVKEVSEDGKLKVIVGVDQDVTEQRQALEALKKSEERFRIVAEAANVMVYEIEAQTDKMHIISGAEQLGGYKSSEIGETTQWAISKMHPDDVPKVVATWNKVRDDPKLDRYVLEYRVMHKNGNYIFVKDTAKAIKNSIGKTVLFIGGMRDITQRKRNREMLKQYSKHLEELVADRTKQLIDYERLAAIGQVAGMVGHDIRNPLQALISEVYLIKSDLEGMPENQEKTDIQESLCSIEGNISYINKIVADLQDYSRKLEPEYQIVNLADLIAEVFNNIVVPKNVRLSFKIKSSTNLHVDPTFTRRSLTNLINNAIQAMPKGGDLEVACQPKDGGICISVADTGGGIPEEVREKMFTPLFTTKSKGQGLGLAVVKRLVEAQGGTICFESTVNKGTKFFITFPKTKQKPKPI